MPGDELPTPLLDESDRPPNRPKPIFAFFLGLIVLAVPTLVALAAVAGAHANARRQLDVQYAVTSDSHALLRAVLVATLVAVWYGALPGEPELVVVIGAACTPSLLVGAVFASAVGRPGPGAWATVLLAIVLATTLGAAAGRAGVRDPAWSAIAVTVLLFGAIAFFGDLVSEAVSVGHSAAVLVAVDVLAAMVASGAAVLLGARRLRHSVQHNTQPGPWQRSSFRSERRVALAPATLSLVVLVLTMVAVLTAHRSAFVAAGVSWLAAPLLWLGLAVVQGLVGLLVIWWRRTVRSTG